MVSNQYVIRFQHALCQRLGTEKQLRELGVAVNSHYGQNLLEMGQN